MTKNESASIGETSMEYTKKLTISAMCIALYCVIMYVTQGISFGAYQIRIATSMYALAYLFPFLVVPLGIANFLSNAIGGIGLVDMIGGCIVGILTTGIIVLIKKCKINIWFIVLPIILIPGCIVPIWLSQFTGAPYLALVSSLCIGQIIPAIFGVILVKILKKVWIY